MERVLCAADSSLIALNIMTSKDMPKQVSVIYHVLIHTNIKSRQPSNIGLFRRYYRTRS